MKCFKLLAATAIFLAPALSQTQQLIVPPGWTIHQEGNNQIVTPEDTPTGAVSVTVQPEEPLNGGTLDSWFANRVAEDTRSRGIPAERGRPSRTSDRVLTTSYVFKDGDGRRYVLLYTGVWKPNGNVQLALIQSPADRNMIEKYVKQSAIIIANLAKPGGSSGSAPPPAAAASSGFRPASVSNRDAQRTTEGDKQRALRVTELGTGVKTEQIVALLHEGRGMTTATGYQYVESVDLVLKDGTVYSGLEMPPDDLNVQASRQLESDKWTKWRKEGGEYFRQNSKTGQWEKIPGIVVKPLEAGARLNRNLIYRSAVSFGGMGGSAFTKTIRLSPDGRFERSASALHGTGVVQSSAGFSSSASSYQDKNGRHGSASGAYTGGPGGSVVATSNSKERGNASDMTGAYEVKGYTLELRSDSGTVQRLLAFYPSLKPGDTDIYINGASYYDPKR